MYQLYFPDIAYQEVNFVLLGASALVFRLTVCLEYLNFNMYVHIFIVMKYVYIEHVYILYICIFLQARCVQYIFPITYIYCNVILFILRRLLQNQFFFMHNNLRKEYNSTHNFVYNSIECIYFNSLSELYSTDVHINNVYNFKVVKKIHKLHARHPVYAHVAVTQ